MNNENYFVGFDIGTDSVGYAVANDSYELCKFKGEPMWGVTLFDTAKLAVERRSFRAARRRLDRRQQRVKLIQELFAETIVKVDKNFYKRIKESYIYPETEGDKVRLFDTYEQQKEFVNMYPTIHHLIVELMENDKPHDPRLVYLACAWLVAHRGHFLSEVDKHNMDAVVDFAAVYNKFVQFVEHDEFALPWGYSVNLDQVQEALKTKCGINNKVKVLSQALFGDKKPPKEVNEEFEYNYALVIKLICGGSVNIGDLFGKVEYANLEEKSVALNMDDDKLAQIYQSIGDDAEFLMVLKAIYDWSVLVNALKGNDSISRAKVGEYEQHACDLKQLKRLVRKYVPSKYDDIFRSLKLSNNYVAYIGKNKTENKRTKVKKTVNQEDFCKYILSIVKSINVDSSDEEEYKELLVRLENREFMPKQVDGDNRVIPYQLYWYELNKILKNASKYIPFLQEKDVDGISGAEKILAVFEFKIPYFVGPLKENSEKDGRVNNWMVRKAQGKIYPWNFENMVDLDRSEQNFIDRMTNACTYLPGEDVLPKNSLVYCAFEVLNEINNIKINGNEIPVVVKQGIFNDRFMQKSKVTPKDIKDYLRINNYIGENDILSGLDETIKSSLKPFLAFRNVVEKKLLTYHDVERIISRATYSEEKSRFKKWLCEEYSHLPETEIKYISNLKFKDFGRLSRKFLCGIEGAVDQHTGEYMSIIRTMWETNNNLMQILSDKFEFKKEIDAFVNEYYDADAKSFSDKLDDMHVSNAVKRPIIRTFDILKDIVKVKGKEPARIFIEMARGAKEDQKGKRTSSRLEQIQKLYNDVKNDYVRELQTILDEWGESAHNRLQSDKLFLYFIQLGKCMYTGKSMDINAVMAGDGAYNIDHIYPRSFVKDDSIINNKVLVDSEANGDKSDSYPIDPQIQEKMKGWWTYLHGAGLLSDEKYKRLIRTTRFTNDERFEFINRQLVETRQSTKVVASLIKQMYPNTEVVYVKAGLVSDFRHEFRLLKSRGINDLHHAQDAYLNIVVGNVWHSKFSHRYWDPNQKYNAKPEIVFVSPVFCGGEMVWKGVSDKNKVVKIVQNNTIHMTKYAFCRKGGFFDQMPVSASSGLVPIKKDRPTQIYGGYNKPSATFFVLTKYKVAKKTDIMFMPVELLNSERFLRDNAFAVEYAKQTISTIVHKPVEDIEFLLNKRILKINTVISLDGFRVCITGKANGGAIVGLSCLTAFKTDIRVEAYVKRLESFAEKQKKNSKIALSETYDNITTEQNVELYDLYIQKFQTAPFKYRPANPCATLIDGREKFCNLAPNEQVMVLLSIQGLFGRAIKADLSEIGGVASAGVATLSSSLSNWKKNYADVRIIDQTASGLFEKRSENILDLL